MPQDALFPSATGKDLVSPCCLISLLQLFREAFQPREISKHEAEYALSQVFIALSLKTLSNYKDIDNTIKKIISDLKGSVPATLEGEIRYPGENIVRIREENKKHGIPVNKDVWRRIIKM